MPDLAPGDLVRIRSRPLLGEAVVVRVNPLVIDLGKGAPLMAWDRRDVVPSTCPDQSS